MTASDRLRSSATEAAGGASPAGGRSVADERCDPRAWACVDLAAIASNAARLAEIAAPAALMAVVKADGYGHGLVASARAALAGGASWLAVAYGTEALSLRAAGIGARTLCLVPVPDEDLDALLRADVDVTASSVPRLDEIARAAQRAGAPARVHLEVDTGLGRGGCPPAEWPTLVTRAVAAQSSGALWVTGIWSHLAFGEDAAHPVTTGQLAVFESALATAERLGARPEVRHLANSGATLGLPAARFDLVRCGIALYGLSPGPALRAPETFGLRPAMTLSARVSLVKAVPAGTGVSYGHRYLTAAPTQLAVVPLGYADGVPRAATNRAEVLVRGGRASSRHWIAGTVCMDQFVVDLGAAAVVRTGDEVVLFGPGDDGEPTAQQWADALDTIPYEIVTRVGRRVPRRFRPGPQ
ncbi:MAG: alanine racemase [Actinomycetia bacterium]|nr:alanine racemase [Actinomycetes bacterium]